MKLILLRLLHAETAAVTAVKPVVLVRLTAEIAPAEEEEEAAAADMFILLLPALSFPAGPIPKV